MLGNGHAALGTHDWAPCWHRGCAWPLHGHHRPGAHLPQYALWHWTALHHGLCAHGELVDGPSGCVEGAPRIQAVDGAPGGYLVDRAARGPLGGDSGLTAGLDQLGGDLDLPLESPGRSVSINIDVP